MRRCLARSARSGSVTNPMIPRRKEREAIERQPIKLRSDKLLRRDLAGADVLGRLPTRIAVRISRRFRAA